MAGVVARYVPLTPPVDGDTATSSSGDWTLDMEKLKSTFAPKTRMLVLNSLHNPVWKVFSVDGLSAIGKLCVERNTIIIADEVYDSLTYMPAKRMATLSPELWKLTLTGWRTGLLIGLEHLIENVAAAHVRTCYSSLSPLQEACAAGYQLTEEMGFWEKPQNEMKDKIQRFIHVLDELGLPSIDPQSGYFVLVNFSRLKFLEGYEFPRSVASSEGL